MTLSPGARLGPYEITGPIGAGGMGEVYKARDTRLDRTVAVKVLPAALVASAELRQRLEREAKTIASLSHPNICALHDVGREGEIDFLVMEYLEGETLGDRIRKGPLAPGAALPIAVDIAQALDHAHRRGISHRDLKPANVMLTKSGARLLDFGLAKLREPQSNGGADGPTVEVSNLTGKGTILGTIQYMAPEQLEGREADARSDLFAFGAVLYEMLAGRKAFEGPSQASVITSIMSAEPRPLAESAPAAPPKLDRIIAKCLAKDPDARWQCAHDLATELRWIAEGSGAPAAGAAPPPPRRERRAWMALAAVLLAACGVLAYLHFGGSPPAPPSVARFLIEPPEGFRLVGISSPSLSPDGRRIVAEGFGPAGWSLWVRSLDSLESRALAGTEGGFFPFWSPDSRHVAFYAGSKLKRVDLETGAVQVLCDAHASGGGSWNSDGVIVFHGHQGQGLLRVAATGGEPRAATSLDLKRNEGVHGWPQFLPDGRRFLFVAFARNQGALYLGSLDSKEVHPIMPATNAARYVEPRHGEGYLVFYRDGSVMAQRFDPDSRRLEGEPVRAAERVAAVAMGMLPGFSAAGGVLAYRRGVGDAVEMAWFDRSGRRLSKAGDAAEYTNPALSPDGKRLAVGRVDPQKKTRDIWVTDLERGVSSRLTVNDADDLNPTWSPDGRRIAFSSNRSGTRDIYWKLSSGAGDEHLFAGGPGVKSVEDWSPDGKTLIYNQTLGKPGDVMALPLEGDAKPRVVLGQPYSEEQARLAPNGRWIAYRSTESGAAEVYVQSYPPAEGKWQISTGGGQEPQWSRDGKELFYLSGAKLMVVDVRTGGASFEAGRPRELFEMLIPSETRRNRFVVSPDGQRFLALVAPDDASSRTFTVVLNLLGGGR